MTELVPERQEYAKKIKSELGDKTIGEIKVEHVFGQFRPPCYFKSPFQSSSRQHLCFCFHSLGGMRGLKVMLWDPSVLDANEGIRFWGRTIPVRLHPTL